MDKVQETACRVLAYIDHSKLRRSSMPCRAKDEEQSRKSWLRVGSLFSQGETASLSLSMTGLPWKCSLIYTLTCFLDFTWTSLRWPPLACFVDDQGNGWSEVVNY